MGPRVSWIVEVAVKSGQLDDFRALMHEMVESTKGETGALSYEWFISEDGSTVALYERYADSDAVLTHLKNFGEKFAGRFLGAVDPTRFTVFGEPNDQARGALSAFGPTYLKTFGGFVR